MWRKPGVLVLVLACVAAASVGIASLSAQQFNRTEIQIHELARYQIENSRSDGPRNGLPYDWLDCIEFYVPRAEASAQRVECESWTAQGVASSVVALKFGTDYVPVIETRLANLPDEGRLVIDIVGGPAGLPFHVNPAMTQQHVERLREIGEPALLNGDMEASPYRQLLDQGFTIISIGYWGTGIRTLEEHGEIELAFDEVRAVIDYYRDQRGEEPPLLTSSLGNHILLGAVGGERLEAMNVLALVPVMDGLQSHLDRVFAETADERATAEANEEIWGDWNYINVYRRSSRKLQFDHSRMAPLYEYFPNYAGGADLPWTSVTLEGPCSRLVLGSRDPRTLGYLAMNTDLPEFITVLNADHDLARDARDETHRIFREYADCLIANEG